jgi:hypothetical protein
MFAYWIRKQKARNHKDPDRCNVADLHWFQCESRSALYQCESGSRKLNLFKSKRIRVRLYSWISK